MPTQSRSDFDSTTLFSGYTRTKTDKEKELDKKLFHGRKTNVEKLAIHGFYKDTSMAANDRMMLRNKMQLQRKQSSMVSAILVTSTLMHQLHHTTPHYTTPHHTTRHYTTSYRTTRLPPVSRHIFIYPLTITTSIPSLHISYHITPHLPTSLAIMPVLSHHITPYFLLTPIRIQPTLPTISLLHYRTVCTVTLTKKFKR